jgi:hypothetical protein
MPLEPVALDDETLLQCGCNLEEDFVEEIYVSLGIIVEEVVAHRKDEGRESIGWKAMGRPERTRVTRILEMMGLSSGGLVGLIQLEE